MKFVTIVGARPQFIKLAPVSRALREAGFLDRIVHTGQHYDHEMSEIFFDELGIPPPDYNLGVGSGLHGAQTGAMLKKIEETLLAEKPDWFIVYGDTNSTLSGALAGAKLHIRVAHVEAGLRSFNREMPEEINRVLTDHISSLLFCPTETAVKNLANEGITNGVHLVGDVMLDGLLDTKERARDRSTILGQLGLAEKQYWLVTVHRAENTDNPQRLRVIMAAVSQLAETQPVIFPVHPRTRNALETIGLPVNLTTVRPQVSGLSPHPLPPNLHFVNPLGYLDMVRLSASARVILTDSGGLQKEAFWLGTPCVTLRNETEWVETVLSGANRLCVPESVEAIVQQARAAARVRGQKAFVHRDGGASSRCVQLLSQCRSQS